MTNCVDLPLRVLEAWPAPEWRDRNVLVAVSGGPDSVALLRALVAAKERACGPGELVLAHYDHATRETPPPDSVGPWATSREDAAWVESLAGRLGMRIVMRRSEQKGARNADSLRAERRAFFGAAAGAVGARFVATGHTASDQAETVLFRALRGAGIEGLAGVAPRARLGEGVTLVRPLLGATRGEVLAYLKAIGQGCRHDPTNSLSDSTRNWVRNELLPVARGRMGSGIDAALVRLAEHARESHELADRLGRRLLEECSPSPTRPAPGVAVRLLLLPLAAAEPLVARSALRAAWRRAGWPERAMTAAHWRRLAALVDARSPRPIELPGGIRAESREGMLVLSPPSKMSPLD